MLDIRYVIATIVWMLLVFYYTRLSIAILINHLLNTSNRKKRKKDQTFKEWFFYKRFLDVIPRKYLIWYYSNFFLSFVVTIVTIVLQLLNFGKSCLGVPLLAYIISSIFYLLIMSYPLHSNQIKIERKKRNKK